MFDTDHNQALTVLKMLSLSKVNVFIYISHHDFYKYLVTFLIFIQALFLFPLFPAPLILFHPMNMAIVRPVHMQEI